MERDFSLERKSGYLPPEKLQEILLGMYPPDLVEELMKMFFPELKETEE